MCASQGGFLPPEKDPLPTPLVVGVGRRAAAHLFEEAAVGFGFGGLAGVFVLDAPLLLDAFEAHLLGAFALGAGFGKELFPACLQR